MDKEAISYLSYEVLRVLKEAWNEGENTNQYGPRLISQEKMKEICNRHGLDWADFLSKIGKFVRVGGNDILLFQDFITYVDFQISLRELEHKRRREERRFKIITLILAAILGLCGGVLSSISIELLKARGFLKPMKEVSSSIKDDHTNLQKNNDISSSDKHNNVVE